MVKTLHKKHAAKSKMAEKNITQKNLTAEPPTDRKMAKNPIYKVRLQKV